MEEMVEGSAVEFRDEDRQDDAVLRLAYNAVDGDWGTFAVEIRASGLSCDEAVASLGGDGLDSFFASLAEDWKGWDGTRTWHALEQGMSIEATHVGNRVELLFIVRGDYQPNSWQLRFPIRVAPGEPLSRLARASADHFHS